MLRPAVSPTTGTTPSPRTGGDRRLPLALYGRSFRGCERRYTGL